MVRAALVILFAISGCSFPKDSTSVEDAVKATLRDPNSAQFQNFEFNEDRSVCGEVNARNAYGGMVGFQPFAVVDEVVFLYSPVNSFEQSVPIINHCSARIDGIVYAMRKEAAQSEY
jgi:hypothetical protein